VMNILLVGAGGFIGAVARYGIVVGADKLISPSFPWGVLTANIFGSLLIGVLAGIADGRHVFSNEARLFLFIGALGGFTTFSSITNDTMALVRISNYGAALSNIALSLILGLSAVAIGYAIAKPAA
jgi:CrcB protein